MADRHLIPVPRKAFYVALVTLAVVAALLAALSLAARWMSGSVNDYRDEFASAASEALGVEVQVDSLHARLRGAGLAVLASGLRLGAVSVQSATIELDGLRSLLRMRPQIAGVYAAGIELDIATGGQHPPVDDWFLRLSRLAALPYLQIDEVAVHWRAGSSAEIRRFENARVVSQRSDRHPDGLRVLVETDLPPDLGRRLRFVGDLHDGVVAGAMDFHLQLEDVDIGGGCALATGGRCWEGRISGALSGETDGSSVQLALTDAVLQPGVSPSPDDAFALSAAAQFPGGATQPFSFALTLAEVPLARIAGWLPPSRLPPPLEAWLRRAPVGGRVTRAQVAFAGTSSELSRVRGWRLTAAVADAELQYRRGHPPLRGVDADVLFDAGALRVNAKRLQVLDTRSENTVVTIADVQRPVLSMNADGHGPLADVLSHLHVLKLFDAYGLTTAHLAASGDSRLRLNLEVPLSRKVKHPTVVAGTLDFEDSGLAFPAPGLEFEKLRGRLSFDRDGGSAEKIDAELRGRAVTIAAQAADGATQLDLRATLAPYPDFADLMATGAPPALERFVSGEAQWRAEVLVPGPGAATAAGGFKVKLTSDLRGIRVNLPAPLGRDGRQAAPFLFETGLGASAPRNVGYGDVFHLALSPSEQGTQREWRFGPGPHEAVPGVLSAAHGAIEQLDFGEWLAWWRAHGGQLQGTGAPLLPDNVDVVIRQAAFGGQALGELAVTTARLPDERLTLRVDSDAAAGAVTFPQADSDSPRVYLDFARLHLDGAMFASTESGAGGLPDPADLPPLAIRIDDFQFDQTAVNDLRVMTNPAPPGLAISRASFSRLDGGQSVGEVRLSGRWDGGESQRSALTFEVESGDYGKLLQLWGFQTSLRGAQGKVSGDLAWNDALPRFGLEKLEGKVVIDTEDGTVETVKPGVGKLLGLLNISEIVQRFTLDFRDIFDKGFTFDRMHGTLSFGGGNMKTENFAIDGASLNLTISGRTGIAARDYDQQIDAVPNLTSNVPLMSAILAGPLAGAVAAAVYVVGKTTRLNEKVDRIVTLRYTLTGSWEDPQVKFVSAPKIRLKPGG